MTDTVLWMPKGEQALDTLRNDLGEIGFVSSGEQTEQETWYDTFDWRLLENDCLLMQNSKTLSFIDSETLCQADTGLSFSDSFQFEWDLPAGDFRVALEKEIEMRAVLPVMQVERRQSSFNLLDSEEKTRARLKIVNLSRLPYAPGAPFLEGSNQSEHQDPEPFATIIALEALKGYESAFEKAHRIVATNCLAANFHDELIRGLRGSGLKPLGYKSKPALTFTPGQPAHTALPQVLRGSISVIRRNLSGLRADTDTEFLHDFRVATRRTRAAITQLKDTLPEDQIEAMKADFKLLGNHTNRLRDLDVYLLGRDRYMDMVPEEQREGLARFFDDLTCQREEALTDVRTFLDTDTFSSLIDRWSAFADQDPSTLPSGKKGGVPLGKLAKKIVQKRYQRIQRDGAALGPHSPDDAIHDLRLECKKLRYALELFDSLFDPTAVKTAVKDLKKLQTKLGDFNDFSVQQITLLEYAHTMKLPSKAVRPTMLAMGFLVAELHREQRACRELCLEAVRNFIGLETRIHFESLLQGMAVTA